MVTFAPLSHHHDAMIAIDNRINFKKQGWNIQISEVMCENFRDFGIESDRSCGASTRFTFGGRKIKF